tara:strand:- start:10866 stop:11252 length:387 start_codon:yes stop_codon:yes gene_type:complete
MSSPYEFVKAINFTKIDIMVDDFEENSYSSYMVNRTLSYFPDTALLANEMNIHHQLDSRLKFDFLRHTIRKGKRFSKWMKPEYPKDLEAVKEYYGYNNEKAKNVMGILSQEQIDEIKVKILKGGTSNR